MNFAHNNKNDDDDKLLMDDIYNHYNIEVMNNGDSDDEDEIIKIGNNRVRIRLFILFIIIIIIIVLKRNSVSHSQRILLIMNFRNLHIVVSPQIVSFIRKKIDYILFSKH